MYGFEISMELVGVSVKTIRQVQIPSQITFKRLHEIISLVFNMEDEISYSFSFEDYDLIIKETGSLNRDTIDAKYELIDKYFEAFHIVTYHNDFWKIKLTVDKNQYDKKYPRLLSIRGWYNPGKDIKSVDDFSRLLEMKKNKDCSENSEMSQLKRVNSLNIQEEFMSLLDIPYKIVNRKVIEIEYDITLDSYL